MKKTLPIAASAAVAALVLAGCSSGAAEGDSSTSPTPTATDGAATAASDCAAVAEDAQGFGADEDIAVLKGLDWCVGEDGLPTVQFEPPSTIAAGATLLVEPGDGEAIEDGDLLLVDYSIVSGGDGTVQYTTAQAGTPEALVINEANLDPALFEAFTTASEGAELIYASVDPSATDPEAATIYMAVNVTSVGAAQAEGAAVEPEAGLPVVTIDEDGKPQVAVGDAEKPAELVVQPLVTGEGDPLEVDDTAVVHYTGWVWDGEQFDSSWDRGAPATFPFVEGGLIQGWIDGLAGQNVGSRVMLVIPPELGYGAEGSGEAIPGDSTLVFVVDILAAL